jgi:transposase
MINLPSGTRIWLVAGVTDMRKSFNGLGELVQHALDENPFSGHLFIFRGRKGDTVKILWADADGLCLFQPTLAATSYGLRPTIPANEPAFIRIDLHSIFTGSQ